MCGAIALILGACAIGTPIAGQTVDDSYKVDGFRWDSGTTVYVLIKTFDAGGKTGVCGAWSARGGSATVSQFHDQVMGAGRVELDGTTLVRNLNFMKENGSTGPFEGMPANCVKTDVDWQARYGGLRPDAVFPRMTVVN